VRGKDLLDVACGLGELAARAARAGASVTAVDLTAAMHARASRRPEHVAWRRADCEELPFADRSFDVVVSTFGVIFASDPGRAAAELRRVCRSHLARNPWTRFFDVPPSPWASEEALTALFPDFQLAFEEHPFSLEAESGAELWDWLVRAAPPTRERLRQLSPSEAGAAASAWVEYLETLRQNDRVVLRQNFLLAVGERSDTA
jgi:SAM-dependent methyltransferase